MQEISQEGRLLDHCECSEYELSEYLNLPGERLLIAKRQHWFVLVGPVFLTFFSAVIVIIFSFVVSSFLSFQMLTVVFGLSLVTILVTCSLLTKIVVDWYYHLYIVTTRKILDVWSAPLFSDNVNDVFLDQVRTTEVDTKVDNVVNQFFDVGDVIIAFDRPSKEKVFVLSSIRNPRQTGMYLGDTLESIMQSSPVWFVKGDESNHAKFHEDVFPEQQKD